MAGEGEGGQQNLKNTWNYNKVPNNYIVVALEEEEIKGRGKEVLKEIMPENFPRS